MIKNIILLLFIIPIINISCNNTVPIEKIVYVPVKDTINEQENIAGSNTDRSTINTLCVSKKVVR